MSDSSKIGRLMGNAKQGGLLDFADVSKLATKAEKREQMLGRCQEIYRSAAERVRSSKGGEYSDPDEHARIKCVELASRLMDLFGADDDSERRQADIMQVAELFRSMGWKVEPPKAA
jgi:hypothetical protein